MLRPDDIRGPKGRWRGLRGDDQAGSKALVVGRAYVDPPRCNRRSKGGGDPQRRHRPLGKSPGPSGAAHADPTESQRGERGAPA
eukprot:11637138-Alexandrium_andersonii.AAC.1